MTELECLGEQIAELAAHLDAATHRLLAAVRDFDARGGWYKQGAVSCAHWLAWRVGWDLVTARERVRVARKLAEFAAIDDALRRGELSYSKVRALLRIATPANEAMIIEYARLTTASQLEMLTRKYALVQRHGQERRPQDDEQRRYVRRRDTEDGMVKLEAVLHPEEAELVWTMLDHVAKQHSRASVAHSHSAGDSAESPGAGRAMVWHSAALGVGASTRVGSNGWGNSAGARESSACAQERSAGDSAELPGAGDAVVWQSAALGVGDSTRVGSNGRENSAGVQESSVCAQERSAGDSAELPGAGDAVVWQPTGLGVSDAALTGSKGRENSAGVQESSACAQERSAGDSAESSGAGDAVVWQPTGLGVSDAALTGSNGRENSAGVQESSACAQERSAGDSAESPGAGDAVVWQPTGLGVSDAALTGSNGWGNSAGVREPSVGDSAESCAGPPVDEARSEAVGAAGGAAELASDCSGSGQSLFDRLVDEVRDAEIERAEQADRDAARAADGSKLDSEPELAENALASAGRRSASASLAQPGMLRRRADAVRCAFDRADALVSVARAYLHGERPQRVPVDVTITIPASSLRRDAVDTVDVGCMGRACISAETARRLSCDAGVVEVIEDEEGVPLSVGRKRRTIAGSIKRALLRRDGACTYPGCANRMFLEGHHIEHWADGGETTLDNAALLCSHHHRFVHEYGYTIELGPDRRPQFRDPHGRVVAPVPARHHGGDLGWPQILAANASLAIDADTIACEWDGKPVRYGRVIDDLVAADGLV